MLPLVYDELHKLAAARLAKEKPGQTLQPTALVHEAYARLVGGDQPQDWAGRGHFFAAAAEAMRRILVEAARKRGRLKRGGRRRRVELAAHPGLGRFLDPPAAPADAPTAGYAPAGGVATGRPTPPGPSWPAGTGWSSRSARAGWAPSGWPSRPSRSGGRSPSS